jgi:hypothetical protein
MYNENKVFKVRCTMKPVQNSQCFHISVYSPTVKILVFKLFLNVVNGFPAFMGGNVQGSNLGVFDPG